MQDNQGKKISGREENTVELPETKPETCGDNAKKYVQSELIYPTQNLLPNMSKIVITARGHSNAFFLCALQGERGGGKQASAVLALSPHLED